MASDNVGDSKHLDAALDLMRRLPPQKVESHLNKLIDLKESLMDDLLQTIDVPLKIKTCKKHHREYLACDYNRDGDSYRSPWSSEYDPPLDDGAQPSAKLRKLEILMNDAFDEYRNQYFDRGTSSVYLWDTDTGFAGAILIKNTGESGGTMKGSWDSIHLIEVDVDAKKMIGNYKTTSTVMLWLRAKSASFGVCDLAGSLTKVAQENGKHIKANTKLFPNEEDKSHLVSVGKLVEDLETNMRRSIAELYFSKTKYAINCCRSVTVLAESKQRKELSAGINADLSK